MEYFLTRKTSQIIDIYTDRPLWPGWLIPQESKVKVYRFLEKLQQYDNRPFSFHSALFCRETGRIYPNARSFFWGEHLDWGFLRQRHPGNWVSWGSLNEPQQTTIRQKHVSLEHFQTIYSSKEAAPSQGDREYFKHRPGPLYVDIDTHCLLGWCRVPDTDFEVLILQKPIQYV